MSAIISSGAHQESYTAGARLARAGEPGEHRWSLRESTRLDVSIRRYVRRCGGTVVAAGVIRNVSLEGVFIEYRRGDEVENSLLELDFELPGVEPMRRYRMPAIVAHVSNTGAGAMFVTFNRAVFTAFQEFLYCRAHRDWCAREANAPECSEPGAHLPADGR